MSPKVWTDTSTDRVKPGSKEWLSYMTASKIAAVMGHSNYDSYFSLWHHMKGTIPSESVNEQELRGLYLEPSVINWFKDQHPELTYAKTGMWIHPEYQWCAATPDGLVFGKRVRDRACVEAKTSDLDWTWGEEGTDQVPAGYYDQAQWQMFCTGFRRTYMPVLMSGLRFAEYVIDYDAKYVQGMFDRAKEFMATLIRNQRPSIDPLDGHLQTYRAIRELNPGIENETVDVEECTAVEFCMAVENRKRAETREQAAKNMLAHLGGDARYVSCDGKKLLTKQSRGGGKPYYVAARGLTTIGANQN